MSTSGVRANRYATVVVGIAVGLLLLLIFRGHWLFSNAVMNPDEAELLAEGKRAHLDLFPYQTYTTSTYLFLWPVFLGIAEWVGIPLTFPTAHIMSGLAYAFMCWSGWYLISRYYGWKWATAITVPTAVFLFAEGTNTLNSAYEFYSLGTELLPITMLFIGVLVLFGPKGHVTRNRLAVAAVVSGTSIWAKPQIGPLALALLGSTILVRVLERAQEHGQQKNIGMFRREVWMDCAAALFFFLLPTAIFLLVIALSGSFSSFHEEAVNTIFGYINVGNGPGVSLFSRLGTVGSFLGRFLLAFVWAIGGMLGWKSRDKSSSLKIVLVQVFAWILPILAGAITLLVLSTIFAHYANLIYAGSMISAIVGAHVSSFSNQQRTPTKGSRIAFGSFLLGSSVVVGLLLANIVWTNVRFISDYVGTAITGHKTTNVVTYTFGASTLPALCPAGSKVLVWGWSAELYSYFNWQPASRYVMNSWQIADSSHRAEYRRVLLGEIEKAPPECIVEAIGPFFFGSVPSTETLSVDIPNVSSLLQSCYLKESSSVGITPPGPLGEIGQPLTVYLHERGCKRPKQLSG